MNILNMTIYFPGLLLGLFNSCKFYNGWYLSSMFIFNSLLSTGVHYSDQRLYQHKVINIIEIRNSWEHRLVDLVLLYSLSFYLSLLIPITKYSEGFHIGYCQSYILSMNTYNSNVKKKKIDKSDGLILVVLSMDYYWV